MREQVRGAIRDPIMLFLEREFSMIATVESDNLADLLTAAVLAVFAERERELRARIEALEPMRRYGTDRQVVYCDDVLAVLDK